MLVEIGMAALERGESRGEFVELSWRIDDRKNLTVEDKYQCTMCVSRVLLGPRWRLEGTQGC